MRPADKKSQVFLESLENQMQGVRGGDRLTDNERRVINRGVEKGNKQALDALSRQRQELMAEQNPGGLPLIFKHGNVIRVRKTNGVTEDGWKVSRYDRAGYVVVTKYDTNQPEGSERTLYFKEFYELNPPDEFCENAEYLDKYRENL